MKSLKSNTRKPTHPSTILREGVFPDLNISLTEIAMRLGVSRRTISEIINERRQSRLIWLTVDENSFKKTGVKLANDELKNECILHKDRLIINDQSRKISEREK